MTELKSTTVYDAYWKSTSVGEGTGLQVYVKSEADAYINELAEHHLSDLQALEKYWAVTCESHERAAVAYAADCFKKVIRHQKHRRCLDKADWCEATALWCYQAANILPVGFHATLYGKPVMIEPARLFKRFELLTKWHERWVELAKKYKEALP